MKISSASAGVPTARPLEASKPEVLAYETRQDQVTIYGENGQALSSSGSADEQVGKLKKLLLPTKMPDSVSADYMATRRWNFLNELAGSTQSYLGTAAALNAVGIGNGPLTVGLAWMVRDGIDGIGKFAGSQFARQADRDPKGWTTRGEYIHAAGMMMEASLAVAPGAFLAIAPAANVVKGFGATVKGAAKAPIEVHQARDNNLGEVRSKNANQDMIAQIIGGALGFGLEKLGASLIGPAATPVLMAAASATRLFATHQYTKALDLDPVTEKRIHNHLRKWLELPKNNQFSKDLKDLEMGAPLSRFVHSPERFQSLTALYAGRNYLLDVHQDKISVALHQDSSPEDQLQAVAQASLIRLLQGSARYAAQVAGEGHDAARDWLLQTSLAGSAAAVASLTRDDDNPLRFESDSRRAHWDKPAPPAGPAASLDKAQLRNLLLSAKPA